MDTNENLAIIDSLIVGCNDAVKILTNGQYIQFCSHMVDMVRVLASLRNGVAEADEKAKKRITELEKLIPEKTEDNENGDT